MEVAVGVEVLVGVSVGVALGLGVCVAVSVGVGVSVSVFVSVAVAVWVGVAVAVSVGSCVTSCPPIIIVGAWSRRFRRPPRVRFDRAEITVASGRIGPRIAQLVGRRAMCYIALFKPYTASK